jgi:hypothetical protein
MELIVRIAMVLSMVAGAAGLSGCVNTAGIDPVEDRANHEAYLESIYTEHDPEYVDDCLAYQELVCEFE